MLPSMSSTFADPVTVLVMVVGAFGGIAGGDDFSWIVVESKPFAKTYVPDPHCEIDVVLFPFLIAVRKKSRTVLSEPKTK